MSEAAEKGKEFCENQPNLIVAAVWAEAQRHFVSRQDQVQFVNGYIDERRKMDEQRPEEKKIENTQD